MPLTDLQKVDRAMSIIYACAEMIAKEPDKTYNTARAQTILHAIDLLREELTVIKPGIEIMSCDPKKEKV